MGAPRRGVTGNERAASRGRARSPPWSSACAATADVPYRPATADRPLQAGAADLRDEFERQVAARGGPDGDEPSHPGAPEGVRTLGNPAAQTKRPTSPAPLRMISGSSPDRSTTVVGSVPH